MIFWAALIAYFFGFSLLLHFLVALFPRLSELFRKAPALDFWIAIFVYLPPVLSALYSGWYGFFSCLAFQIFYLTIYSFIHGSAYRIFKKQKGGRLLFSLSKGLNRPRVLLGFYFTLLAIPVFIIVRFGQWLVYPLLVWTLDFPKYKHADWIQLSRHKFQGLVGLDLLWCLYCEWAAGVYSLGAEMIRNNESFWCPIRFYEGKHCENCQVDFPDIQQWVSAEGSIDEVQKLQEVKYPRSQSPKAWYGHPSRKNS